MGVHPLQGSGQPAFESTNRRTIAYANYPVIKDTIIKGVANLIVGYLIVYLLNLIPRLQVIGFVC